MLKCLELENKDTHDLYIKFYGMQECPPNYSYGPATRHHYLVYYCLSGKGYYHVNNKMYTIKAGDAFLILPHVVTYYQADAHQPWTYMWMGFDGTKASLYLNYCQLNKQQFIIHNDHIEDFKSIITSMLEHRKLSYSNELYLQSKLYEFLSLLARTPPKLCVDNSIHSHHQYVNKAIEYIHNHYQNKVSIREIADYLSLNRSYLTTLFKQQLDLSPQEFLSNYRMEQARYYLLNTSLTIHQIAYSCGYANQLSFSKAFSKHHQIPPREYRNKYRQIKT